MMNRLTIYPLIATLILTMLLIAACNSPETDAPAEPTSAPASQQSEALPVDTAGPTSTVEAKQADESVASTAAESEQASEAGAEPEPTEAPFFFNLLAYEVPRMNEVVVENVAYGLHEGAPLTMDIYYPPDVAADAQLPVVVYVMGYRDDSSAIGGPLKDIGAYDSWGRLTAASGMVGVAYQTYQPEDLEAVVEFVRTNAADLKVDPDTIGLWSSSANTPTAISFAMQEEEDYLKFGVFYYGFMLTPDNTFRQEFNETCEQRGCYGVEVADVEALRTDFPLLVAKAGRDRIPQVNDSIDHFMSVAEAEGVPVTYLENPKGHHGFDTEDRNLEESGQIIAQTLDFMMHNFGIDEQAPATDAQGEAQGHEGSLVLHNGTVVTVNGDDPIPNAAVVVEDGLITAVGPEADMVFPEGATVIDVGGRTILPGLIDARTSVLNHLVVDEGEFDNVNLQIFLANALKGGITTVRDTGSHWGISQDIDELRAALEANGNTVPTVVLTGPTLAHPEGSALNRYPELSYAVGSVDEAQETAAQLIQAGVDQIGFVQSVTQEAGNGSHDGLPPTLSDDQLGAIVEVAHQNGVWVTGQAVFPDEAKIILDAGVDELANWPSQAIPIPDDLLQTLVSRSTPVVSGFNVLPPQEGDIRRFLDAGGMLVFGTYAPNSGSIHKPYREFQVMSLNDMTPMEMIQSATANAAYAVGLGDAVGTLEVGKQADVIVVDGDPFEDFRVMREEMVYVVKGGELVVQPEEA